ncbi:MAG: pyruvate kinase [Phycisphaeraceae bacterium]|nr:pyruvate kinase [Phycisphaeraceae bacterium]
MALSFLLTKIVATLGPACARPAEMKRLIDAGTRVFRLNFSHGSPDDHEALLTAARKAAVSADRPIAIIGDLSGPKIRVGPVVEGGIILKAGQRVDFTIGEVIAGKTEPDTDAAVVLSTTLSQILDDAQPGQRLLIDDGAVRLLIINKIKDDHGPRLVARVTVGGTVTAGKGINLPDSDLTLPSLTEHDRRCVDWALEHELDYLALSFVRSAADLTDLKEKIAGQTDDGAVPVPIIAKIEKPQALNDLDGILDEADAVMVARGDLGVEMDVTRVPILQKKIINRAHDYGKPVIVATQMLQSMIERPYPTRAEVSDVAQAILDGADAVMLSGETAVGNHPERSVEMMARVARTTQGHLAGEGRRPVNPPKLLQESRYRTAAMAHGVSVIVRDMDVHLIAIWSQRAGGARYLSQNRLAIPIVAASSNPKIVRRMTLMYGIIPLQMDKPADTGAFAERIDDQIVQRDWADAGEPIVIVAGEPIGTPGVTNTVLVHYLGEACHLGDTPDRDAPSPEDG